MNEHLNERASERLVTEAECRALAQQVFDLGRGGGETEVVITGWWSGDLRWGRNRTTLAGDRRETVVIVRRRLNGADGEVWTNQLGPAALEAAVRAAERMARHARTRADDLEGRLLQQFDHPKAAIWSDATYGLTAEERGRVAQGLIEAAQAAGLLSAGYLAAEAQAMAYLETSGRRLYGRQTQARCAMTVRDQGATGSGWAGKTSYDWAKLDGAALARRAIEKCLASRNPVALEPGRYTVILEPQAVADLLSLLFDDGILMGRSGSEGQIGGGPFWLRKDYSKLGLKVADERVTIGYDPMDPNLGALAIFATSGEPLRAVNWIDRGVLVALPHERGYALRALTRNLGFPYFPAFRMQGGETSIEEMIRTTRRGLLVTRFSNLRLLEKRSVLCSGFTRDGLWLIEHGKITKPVKNFRFTDSPLFVLNNLEQLGPAEPVFRPGHAPIGNLLQPAVVPPLKARDFSFTALADAI